MLSSNDLCAKDLAFDNDKGTEAEFGLTIHRLGYPVEWKPHRHNALLFSFASSTLDSHQLLLTWMGPVYRNRFGIRLVYRNRFGIRLAAYSRRLNLVECCVGAPSGAFLLSHYIKLLTMLSLLPQTKKEFSIWSCSVWLSWLGFKLIERGHCISA